MSRLSVVCRSLEKLVDMVSSTRAGSKTSLLEKPGIFFGALMQVMFWGRHDAARILSTYLFLKGNSGECRSRNGSERLTLLKPTASRWFFVDGKVGQRPFVSRRCRRPYEH